MSEDLVRELATAIAKEQLIYQWPIFGLMVALIFVVGYFSSYLGAYAKRRGESFATKADFEELLTQVKATTAATEQVKTQVLHADWSSRELKTLRRVKLEELLMSLHQTEAWQDSLRDFYCYEHGSAPGESPITKVRVLSGLYFPELQEPIRDFAHLHLRVRATIFEAGVQKLSANGGSKDAQAKWSALISKSEGFQSDQYSVVEVIEAASRRIMAELVGL